MSMSQQDMPYTAMTASGFADFIVVARCSVETSRYNDRQEERVLVHRDVPWWWNFCYGDADVILQWYGYPATHGDFGHARIWLLFRWVAEPRAIAKVVFVKPYCVSSGSPFISTIRFHPLPFSQLEATIHKVNGNFSLSLWRSQSFTRSPWSFYLNMMLDTWCFMLDTMILNATLGWMSYASAMGTQRPLFHYAVNDSCQ